MQIKATSCRRRTRQKGGGHFCTCTQTHYKSIHKRTLKNSHPYSSQSVRIQHTCFRTTQAGFHISPLLSTHTQWRFRRDDDDVILLLQSRVEAGKERATEREREERAERESFFDFKLLSNAKAATDGRKERRRRRLRRFPLFPLAERERGLKSSLPPTRPSSPSPTSEGSFSGERWNTHIYT